MKLLLCNTPTGMLPVGDDSYDEKRKLKLGEIYSAEIKLTRNYRFHKKYFALINLAWAYLPERQVSGFRNVNNFRKYVEVAAGYFDLFYSPKNKEWVEIPKSISFSSMDEAEFNELYERVKDVIFRIIGRYVTKEDFSNNLANF